MVGLPGGITSILAGLVGLVGLACIQAACAGAPPVPRAPNIVFFLIDDLGWMDLACQGNPLIETPAIDRLASQGMRFTDAYAAAPVCSPTRAAALTGESLMPLLCRTGGLKRTSICFHYPNYAWRRANRLGSAIRKGSFKLIKRFDDWSVELYDLDEDLGETRDLAARLPAKAAELRGELHG